MTSEGFLASPKPRPFFYGDAKQGRVGINVTMLVVLMYSDISNFTF